MGYTRVNVFEILGGAAGRIVRAVTHTAFNGGRSVPDLWSDFRKIRDDLRGRVFTARIILGIVICPLIGIFLFLLAISEKGFAHLTFGDIYPAISISLAGIVFAVLYRFVTRPIKLDDKSAGEKTTIQGSPPSTQP